MAARSASLVRLAALTLVLSSATPAAAQMSDPRTLVELSLEELLKIPITSASKFEQELAEVPASVTVVTRQEIQRYGHRTLADVLRSVRGFYTSSDRAYSYAGASTTAIPIRARSVPICPSTWRSSTASRWCAGPGRRSTAPTRCSR
jgi:outer membrane receptor for ferrienterochelin and colicin